LWIKVRIRKPSSDIERVVSAYANSGYEAGEPTIALPMSLVSSLGLERRGISLGLDAEGRPFWIYELEPSEVEVKVEVEDRTTPWVRCRVESSPGRREVLMSAELLSLLKIELLFGPMKWRLEDDEPGVKRKQAEPQIFPSSVEKMN